MYRFLLTPRWLGLAAASIALAAVMVGLGRWQLYRYHLHASVNARVAAAAAATPVPVNQVLRVGASPPSGAAWTKVTLTGHYDADHEILARERSLNSAVGFEVLVPLVLPDGTAALVDRGWIPPAAGGSIARPDVPPVPAGTVTVIGRVHLPESGPTTPIEIDGYPQVRTINPARLATVAAHPLYGGYILLDQQRPPANPVFASIPSDHENAWQNAGYVIQWWLFAAMTLVGYVLLARREAHPEKQPAGDRDHPRRDRAGADLDRYRDRDPTYTGYEYGYSQDAAGRANSGSRANSGGQANPSRPADPSGQADAGRPPNAGGQTEPHGQANAGGQAKPGGPADDAATAAIER